jgi:DNA-binding MarR family transcriptional regulator
MAPTKRQLQYLATVASLYQEMGQPVHYTDVAQRMGVSKWTAHDVLTLLSKAGLVEQEYQIRREERSAGRSSVLFYPTRAGYSELEGVSRGAHLERGEQDLRSQLLAKLDEAGQKGIDSVLRETFDELPELKTPLAFCANLVLILVLCIWIAAQRSQWKLNLKELPASASEEALLILLAGLTLGIVFKGRSEAMKLEVGSTGTTPAGGYLQLALQDSDQRMAFLNLVEMATKRISSEWPLTGEEDRAVLMSFADRAMSKTLLN